MLLQLLWEILIKNCKSELIIRRQKQMDRIENGDISLQTYLLIIGILTFHFDKRVSKSRSLDNTGMDSNDSFVQIIHIIFPESMKLASPVLNKSTNNSKMGKDIPSPVPPKVNISFQGKDWQEKQKKVRSQKKI